MTKLYEITGSIRELLGTLDQGELSDEQLAALDALGLELSAKIDGCCGLIAEWSSVIAARQAEIDRLKAGIDTKQNAIKRLKEYLKLNLETLGVRKHETAIWSVRTQANPPSAKCTLPVDELTDDFTRTKKEPNNAAAIDYWKSNGIAPRGFEISVSSHLRIT